MLEIIENISSIRLFGIGLSSILFFLLFVKTRNPIGHKDNRQLFFVLAIALLTVGIFPDVVNLPTSLLNFDKIYPFGGRIITLIFLATIITGYLILHERSKRIKSDHRLELLIRKTTTDSFLLKNSQNNVNIALVIPAYNEAENVSLLINRLPKTISGKKIGPIFIDDGSSDDTVKVIENHGQHVASLPFNMGQGTAQRLGFDIAHKMGAEIVVTLDADGQHRPEEIESLIEPILKNQSDMVIGSRIIGSHDRTSRVRSTGIYFFNWMISFLTGHKVTDCSSGFRAFKLSELAKIKMIESQFQGTEVIIEAIKKKLRISEVPIHIETRKSGESKKGTNLSYGFNFLKVILKTWVRSN